jgi:hypothetical protein
MAIVKQYIQHANSLVPRIVGSKGGKGGGGGEPPAPAVESPNSLFSTDILFVTVGLGEGPLYRVNPNGVQDIQIQDSSVDDLVNLDGDGNANTDKFVFSYTTGTTTQNPLAVFGEAIVTPQTFGGAVDLKYGNLAGIPKSAITLQDTSQADWDALSFQFLIGSLQRQEENGDTNPHGVSVSVKVFDRLGTTEIASATRAINGKTTTAFKFGIKITIPDEYKSLDGYRFTVEKASADTDSSRITDNVSLIGWNEIENSRQAYPRTAIIGYAIKAENEHTGGVPSFTSLVKGLLVKVPSNYNQPILSNGEIDWREVEIPASTLSTTGYRLQKSGTDVILTEANPQMYVGTWDGTFVYSWTQNPAWIIYDILTNNTYGLGIAENNIDKFKFYQVAQYADACDVTTGRFNGVSGMADGSFRNKPRGQFTSIRENQVGLGKGIIVSERRFVTDITISEQGQTIDLLNSLAASIRAAIIYAGGKLSLAIDMPDEFPVMLFNEATIKDGSFQISGTKESDTITGVDISYIEPSNHFRREVVRIDSADSNDGTDTAVVDNIASLELMGVTRRSQAMRAAQYQIASTKYIRRTVTFGTGTEAMYLSPGDVIAIASQGTGIAYGYGGKVIANTAISIGIDTNVTLEHFTVPGLTENVFTSNTYPLALRVIRSDSDQMDVFLLSNTTYGLFNTGNVATGYDTANVQVIARFDPTTKSMIAVDAGLTANIAPRAGDLWSLGQFENIGNYYSNKSGKLFKVTDISREPEEESFLISAVEYISNIYIDSDTFINYEPTAYTDIDSPLTVPPVPIINFKAVPRRRLDGSVAIDGVIEESSDRFGYGQSFAAIYEISKPSDSITIDKITAVNPLTITLDTIGNITDGTTPATLVGKNGYTTNIGSIKLLCNSYSIVDTEGGTLEGNIQLQIDGLENAFDKNFNKHVLAVNDGGVFGTLKGSDYVSIPVIEKANTGALLNFVGYKTRISNISRAISGYDTVNNTIKLENISTNDLPLVNVLPLPPFYITIDQLLDSRYYNNNSFFIKGTDYTYINEGTVDLTVPTNLLDIDIKPVSPNFVRLYIDGLEKSKGQFSVNTNRDLLIKANISYPITSVDTSYRIEVDHYTVPTIEVGDIIQPYAGNVFTVSTTTYDPASSDYNVAMTANSVFRIATNSKPVANLSGLSFVNVSPNPVGVLNNTSANSITFDYDTSAYAGSFNLANNRVYDIQVGGQYDRLLLTSDLTIRDLAVGTTTLRARNKSVMGRASHYTTKSINVSYIPIQKVNNLTILESLYREQSGGVSVRATVIFDHILNQEVTDYEISYKLDNVDRVGDDDGGASLTSFNTVKIPAAGVEADGKIRFTVNGLNRGVTSETNSITFRVTPLNKSIRGIVATVSKSIIGKTAKPLPIRAFTGGQQNDQVTLFWQYFRVNGELADLDLKEVVLRRAPGTVSFTIENYIASDPFVTVSAGSTRKSIPIDTFGTYTYLARTRDTSGNFSDEVVGVTLTTTKPQRATTVAAYSEDAPDTQFSSIPNNNLGETNFPSFANSNTGGIAYAYTSAVDNANGSSSGWSALVGLPTDLLAIESAEYITQIRDFGSIVNGAILLDIEATQEIQSTFNDQHEEYVESVSEPSAQSNVLVDVDFGGIGHILGFANAAITTGRYDVSNQTWMTGPAEGNVWAIWNHGQYVGDDSNANSYALIAGVINANAIALGASYYANGDSTESNAFSNITAGSSIYTLVNFTQYSDTGELSYAGDLGAISSQTFIRTSSSENLYFANGNVDITQFDAASTNNGYIPYEAGTKVFRYFQIKFAVNNLKPDEFDFTIDKFRYTIDKEQTVFTDTVLYDSSPKTIDYTASKFINRPVISYAVLDSINQEQNPLIVITTAASNSSVSFKLLNSQSGGGEYAANSTSNVMITVVGV